MYSKDKIQSLQQSTTAFIKKAQNASIENNEIELGYNCNTFPCCGTDQLLGKAYRTR